MSAQAVALAFLSQVPPFRYLDRETLAEVVARAEVHFFPRGTRILQRDGPPARYLYVVEKGGVKKAVGDVTLEVVGEGEVFGVLSALEGDRSRLDVIAVDDTVCYAVPREVVEKLLETQPQFARYLYEFSIRRYLDWSLEELERAPALAGSGRLIFTARAGEVARRPLVTCQPETTIREAAQLMSHNRVSSVVVLGPGGEAAGIVTDWDLRERVVAAGRDIRQPVAKIMTSPVVSVDADAPVYQVVSEMVRRGIHHIVVTEASRPAGMIAGHDLILLQGTSALFVARDIERRHDLPGLRQVVAESQRVVPFLLRQGIRASELGRLMTDINDRIIGRVLEFTEAALGPPPVPYCWLVLGSEGRREQTFRTDQDNAIIYADPPPEGAEAVREYFLEFGRRAVAALVEVGFPPCPGRYTAENPEWVQSLSGWKTHFRRWVATPEPEAVLNSLIFFDFRGIYGDLTLADGLRVYVNELLPASRLFLVHLAWLSTKTPPPLGFLGRFIVEAGGEHRNELDLKARGTRPIVDLARFLALRHGVAETSTVGRLEALRDTGKVPEDLAEELTQAFEFILSLRIRSQWTQIQGGETPHNFVSPGQLSALERSLLKEAFKAVSRAQTVVRQEYYADLVAD
jgi:CBS domain-containing protein